MPALKGRVVVITGADRGLGRAHALFFAAQRATVVVNGSPGSRRTGDQRTRAMQVVDEIRAAGGEAVANHDEVWRWDGAKRLIKQAVDSYGDLHVLVNSASALRDRTLVRMTEEEWDSMIRVHLRGHFCTNRLAASYWRDQYKAGHHVDRAILNTVAPSGLFGNIGQANHGAAKSGIAALSIIGDAELGRYQVRVNAIAPIPKRSSTVSDEPRAASASADNGTQFAFGSTSPFAAYLASESCPVHGRLFLVDGDTIRLVQPFSIAGSLHKQGRWTVEELQSEQERLLSIPVSAGYDLGQ